MRVCSELADGLGSAVQKLLALYRGKRERFKSGEVWILPLWLQRVVKSSWHVAVLASLDRGPERPFCEAGKVKPGSGRHPRRWRNKAKNLPSEANCKEWKQLKRKGYVAGNETGRMEPCNNPFETKSQTLSLELLDLIFDPTDFQSSFGPVFLHYIPFISLKKKMYILCHCKLYVRSMSLFCFVA